MSKFKVGDRVQVVDPGSTYTSFDCMFVKLGFRDREVNQSFQKGLTARVFAVDEHPITGLLLLALQAKDGSQCLINVDGVGKISTEMSSEDEFDIIRQFCDEALQSQVISDRIIFKHLLRKCCK